MKTSIPINKTCYKPWLNSKYYIKIISYRIHIYIIIKHKFNLLNYQTRFIKEKYVSLFKNTKNMSFSFTLPYHFIYIKRRIKIRKHKERLEPSSKRTNPMLR
jgi:hypothetical protein